MIKLRCLDIGLFLQNGGKPFFAPPNGFVAFAEN